MSGFFTDLWESVFTPGTTPTLLVATNATFAALQAVLLALLVATYSIHFIVLSGLCAGLWWAINWFAREMQEAQRLERLAKDRAPPPQALSSSEDETDVEPAALAEPETATTSQAQPDVTGSELKQRAVPASTAAPLASAVSSKSGMSTETEDEWEKVSESEEKDQ